MTRDKSTLAKDDRPSGVDSTCPYLRTLPPTSQGRSRANFDSNCSRFD
jgi:hypothetical protein